MSLCHVDNLLISGGGGVARLAWGTTPHIPLHPPPTYAVSPRSPLSKCQDRGDNTLDNAKKIFGEK
jgi:hypothetical protein